MSIRLSNYPLEFLHLPKTGGVWVEKALESAGIKLKRLGHEHGNYDRVLAEQLSANGWIPPRLGRRIYQVRRKMGKPVEQPKRFCFVRHPFKWYESYWRFMMEHDWFMYGHPNCPERWHPWSELLHIKEGDFNTFIARAVRDRPGYLSHLYQSFCKSGITYIGKTESLANDLEKILTLEKVTHDSNIILKQERANTTDKKKLPVDWDPELRKRLFFAELHAFLAFDYFDEETSSWLHRSEIPSAEQFTHRSLLD